MADVIMPQMGESIAEGTVTKWLKAVGDTIERDEPLFEISTDKVDAEIPAPAAGVLREIRVPPGTTVEVNTVVALIESVGLLQTRNHLNYSTGGINVGTNDKTPLLMQWLQYYRSFTE